MKKILLICLTSFPFYTKCTQAEPDKVQSFFDEIEKHFNESVARLHQVFSENADTITENIHDNIGKTKAIMKSELSRNLNFSLDLKTYEKDEKYIIEANVAGFKKGEVSAEIDENRDGISILAIKAETKESKEEHKSDKKSSSSRSSFSHKSLKKIVRLPRTVDISSYDASHEDGVFTIIFKLKKEAPSKKIQITIDE
jgi:HSP20 family molecular chaperone IbpA